MRATSPNPTHGTSPLAAPGPRSGQALQRVREGDGVLSACLSSPSLAASQLLEEAAGDRKLLLLSGSPTASGIPLRKAHSTALMPSPSSPLPQRRSSGVRRSSRLPGGQLPRPLCAPQRALPRARCALRAGAAGSAALHLLTRDRNFWADCSSASSTSRLALHSRTLRDQLTAMGPDPGARSSPERGVCRSSRADPLQRRWRSRRRETGCVAPQGGSGAGWSW